MYEYIKGTFAYAGDNYAVVDSNGIGYKIITPSGGFAGITHGTSVTYYTKLHVKEDVFELYGFLSRDERTMFETLLSVSGVGPKAAISILSTLSPSNLTIAIVTDNTKAITASPGVGPKLAKRIILELKDKISTDKILSPDDNPTQDLSSENEAIAALTALGYSFADAAAAVANAPGDLSTEETIKFALKSFLK